MADQASSIRPSPSIGQAPRVPGGKPRSMECASRDRAESGMFPASTGGTDIQFRSGIRFSIDPVVGGGLDRATPRDRASDRSSTHSVGAISSSRWAENHVRGHQRVVRAAEQTRAPDAGPSIDEGARRQAHRIAISRIDLSWRTPWRTGALQSIGEWRPQSKRRPRIAFTIK
jgi:hypothetical protein